MASWFVKDKYGVGRKSVTESMQAAVALLVNEILRLCEAKFFEPGDRRCVVDWRGWKVFLTICYDLRFPVWMRYSEEIPYDIILCVANWPYPRQEAWKTLIRARAIDNQAYVLGCNRVGQGPKTLLYPGDSVISDPKGELLHPIIRDEELVMRATLDRNEVSSFREGFPVLKDADYCSCR